MTETIDTIERRDSRRLACKLIVNFVTANTSTGAIGEASDISYSGMRVLSEIEFKEPEVTMHINNPISDHKMSGIDLKASIAWSRKLDNVGLHCYGLKFIEYTAIEKHFVGIILNQSGI